METYIKRKMCLCFDGYDDCHGVSKYDRNGDDIDDVKDDDMVMMMLTTMTIMVITMVGMTAKVGMG